MKQLSLQATRPQTIPSPGQVRRDVNSALDQFFKTELDKAVLIGPSYAQLWGAMRQLILAGGKRFRPYLTVLSYHAHGGNDYEKIIPVAVSQELLHASLLIHDDIIDRDFTRYGQQNVAGLFRKKYQAVTNDTTATHYAHSAALLAGDLALSAAHQWLLFADFPDQYKRVAMHFFGTSMFEVAGGELLDTEAALYAPDAPDSLATARYKTASYSIISPLCIGAVMAGAGSETTTLLQRIGEPLGIAYQLADDMLGLFGDEALTGKPLLSDLREGKRTYIMQAALRNANSSERAAITQALGNPHASLGQLQEVQRIAIQNGAKAYVEEKIAAYEERALTTLANLNLSTEATAALRQFITRALKRNA